MLSYCLLSVKWTLFSVKKQDFRFDKLKNNQAKIKRNETNFIATDKKYNSNKF